MDESASKRKLLHRIKDLIDDKINPEIGMHGGFVVLLDVDAANRVFIQMGGGCQGCGMADVTLRQGIEALIRERFPEVAEVVDTTDHAHGSNPYYKPGK